MHGYQGGDANVHGIDPDGSLERRAGAGGSPGTRPDRSPSG